MSKAAPKRSLRSNKTTGKIRFSSPKKSQAQNLLIPLYFLLYILLKIGQFVLFLNSLIIKKSQQGLTQAGYLVQKSRQILLTSGPPVKPVTKPAKPTFLPQTLSKVTLTKIVLLSLLVIILSSAYFFKQLLGQLPSPYLLDEANPPLTSQIYDRHGVLLYQFYADKNRQLVNLQQIPQNLINATIAIEDKHFYEHPGIDPLGIIRALRNNYENQNGNLQGGSTITQQLIKNTLLTPDQTITRKIKEVILAFWLERIYDKSQILQMYFNEVPYGGLSWGAQAAAQTYFGKDAHDLDLAESAYLAGLPTAPTEYSPYGAHPEQGKQRQKEVLQRMVEDNYITANQATKAFAEPLNFKPPVQTILAPHFVMYVKSLLVQKYGERMVSQGGLKITTTLDLKLEQMAEKVVGDEVSKLARLKVSNGAAMILDAHTGQILAMVGSKNYFDPQQGNVNVALSLRQPGSSIKVITYATAFKQGFTPGTILLDTPTNFKNTWGYSYSPVNYDGRFHGPVTIRTALGSSYNIPAVKTLALEGIPQFLQTAQDLGITTLTDTNNYGLSLTLGAGDVTLLQMMGVYDTFAQAGVKHTPQAILTITNSKGIVIEDHSKDQGQQVLTPQVAYLVTNILSDPKARMPAFGTNSGLEITGHTVAVKTGTSDNKRDNWAFGYTPNYVVGAWVGNNDNSPMDPQLSSGITGATPIWHDLMTNLLQNIPNQDFAKPAGIIEASIDGHKDLAISGQVPKNVVSQKKETQTDGDGHQKEVITYYDNFSTFIPKPTQTVQ
ncbi:MAG: PBP1A family penicillin-binding protein [Patescibacteria group bacterium]|nr:PBP1A family penicillin-binding protein [Patescibacteria group bacterium]